MSTSWQTELDYEISTGAAKKGAAEAVNDKVDTELFEVRDVWPAPPAPIKTHILEMVCGGSGLASTAMA